MTGTQFDNPTASGRWWADLNLAVVACIWGVNMPVMKFALGRVDEYLFNAMRLSFSALMLGLLVYLRSRKRSSSNLPAGNRPVTGLIRIRQFSRRQWAHVALFSFLAGFAYQICFLLGIDRTTAGNTAIIMSAIPVWTAVLAFFILSERLKFGAWIGLLIALTGVLVVTFGRPVVVEGQATINSAGSLTGNLIVSLAAFSWAFASVVSRPLMKSVSPLDLAFFSVALTVPFHFLIAGSAVADIGDVFTDWKLGIAVVYSGVFSTGLAYAMWNYGVQQLGASHAAGFQNLVPLVALVAGWVLINEVPYLLQLAGGALIIVGLVTMRRRR